MWALSVHRLGGRGLILQVQLNEHTLLPLRLLNFLVAALVADLEDIFADDQRWSAVLFLFLYDFAVRRATDASYAFVFLFCADTSLLMTSLSCGILLLYCEDLLAC